MSKDYTFNPGDFVVYPAHGVGQVTEIQKTAVSGQELNLIAINFNKDKLTLRIPLNSAQKSGLRQVSSAEDLNAALHILKGKAKVRRVQWSKRAQEYTAKINSGIIENTAEVIRDLYKNPAIGEQTYSERQIYEQAMNRMASEFAVVNSCSQEEATLQLEQILRDKSSTRL